MGHVNFLYSTAVSDDQYFCLDDGSDFTEV
jgi:hypothetical protein